MTQSRPRGYRIVDPYNAIACSGSSSGVRSMHFLADASNVGRLEPDMLHLGPRQDEDRAGQDGRHPKRCR